MKISVIIPAYNEEARLPATLKQVREALAIAGRPAEVIVVNNDSTDGTKRIAEDFGAKILSYHDHNISQVRNAGAEQATGDVLIFIDADTLVPETLFKQIARVMEDEKCFGGAVAVIYEVAKRKWVKYYLWAWQFWGNVLNMRQGAAQFCRRRAFEDIGGYDGTIFVGEDIEFHWRLSKFARRHQGYLHFVDDPQVTTSARRFEKMGVWKTLLITHPIFILLLWRRKAFWKDWYENAVR